MLLTPPATPPARPLWHHLLLILATLAAVAGLEHAMGRVWLSKSGQVFFWVNEVHSPENSQQIADWYSFSHIIHGFLLYALFHWIVRRARWSLGACLALAVLVESSWECLENSSFIIDRYRQDTLAWDYSGDSVLNSLCDIFFCMLGFLLAARLPVWLTVLLAVAMELLCLYAIRDGLVLNVIMLLHPIEAIKHWQAGVG